ncbi:chorismate mutase family protein [Streptomyces sp. DSM 41014]|uniref:Chorismate mutase family protein n=2 Tax=Streptomyces TaxID=1883 RepID=A0ABU2USM0_9ACTN|nr:chorismate mutase family protein [Streptomyces sp. DSM 41014]MDT0476285.1 chorismate mutase family protein [Streptomyces sp. DSM 41014]
MTQAAAAHDLDTLRDDLAQRDDQLLHLLRERLDICAQIARYKQEHGLPVMQPDRIAVAQERAAAFGAEHGVDQGFLRRLYDLLIEEACRVEEEIVDPGSRRPAGGSRLARHAQRIDHVAIAVRELEPAIELFRDRYGFELVERRVVDGAASGMDSATLQAGGVTFVLCQGDSPESNVSRYIEHYGPGVQHVALEVSEQAQVQDDLRERDADLLTGIIHGPGLDQSFTRRDTNSGIQLEFVTRTGNEGFDDTNVRELFTAMERDGAF